MYSDLFYFILFYLFIYLLYFLFILLEIHWDSWISIFLINLATASPDILWHILFSIWDSIHGN